jgi:microsomal dipeptidase-like Zn-dependent dipeptidase
VAHALVDCPDHVAAGGRAAVLENLTGSGDPLATHDPVGWPTFRDWPAPRSLTHEQTYHRWVERAWRGGLRMIVQLLVENRVLCEIYPLKDRPCDEMASVRRQAADMRALERYIDAQHGGPGQGWLRIVEDPAAARRVINEGKLAVLLGIEISEPFGCRAVLDAPLCTAAQIDAGLDELADLGVRQVFLIHKLDNALGGVKGDAGPSGLFTNPGNLLSTGHLLDMRACPPGSDGAHDNHQELPVYPEGPHCNARGLSDLGAHAVEAVIDRGLILDVDHMSGRARDAALDLLERRGHSGVVSSHGWADADSLPRILELGGVVSPYASASPGFVRDWEVLRPLAPDRYLFGVGFGADSNGLGGQPTARKGPDPVRYPFAGFGGTTISRQVTGQRTFDVNVDGVAHYGLYPDWIEDLRHLAGDEILGDLERGPEAYLQMWERAAGVPRVADGCLVPGAAERVQPGMSPEDVLRTAGQPQRRTAEAFVYCDGEVRFDAASRATTVRRAGAAVTARSLAAVVWDAAGGLRPARA